MVFLNSYLKRYSILRFLNSYCLRSTSLPAFPLPTILVLTMLGYIPIQSFNCIFMDLLFRSLFNPFLNLQTSFAFTASHESKYQKLVTCCVNKYSLFRQMGILKYSVRKASFQHCGIWKITENNCSASLFLCVCCLAGSLYSFLLFGLFHTPRSVFCTGELYMNLE